MFGSKTYRVCNKCGKERRLAVNAGALCESGHFVCVKCGRKSLIGMFFTLWNPLSWFSEFRVMLGLSSDVKMFMKRKCPVCDARLRAIKTRDVAAG